jgi:hypothetical protein
VQRECLKRACWTGGKVGGWRKVKWPTLLRSRAPFNSGRRGSHEHGCPHSSCHMRHLVLVFTKVTRVLRRIIVLVLVLQGQICRYCRDYLYFIPVSRQKDTVQTPVNLRSTNIYLGGRVRVPTCYSGQPYSLGGRIQRCLVPGSANRVRVRARVQVCGSVLDCEEKIVQKGVDGKYFSAVK